MSSGVTTAVSWAVSPAVARLVAPLAQLWHHVLVMVAAPESSSPLDMVRLARQELGPCPLGGGTEEQRCCETLGCGSHPLPTAGDTWGTHPLMQVALRMV